MLTPDGKLYHIHCKPGDVGRYVLLPGDPFRTDLIASYFDDAKLVAHNREHKTWTGTLNGVKVSVTSTGMGCPSAAIAAEELMNIGAECLIRIGSSAALQDDIKIGDLMTLGCAFLFACQIVTTGILALKMDAKVIVFLQFAVAAVWGFFAFLLTDGDFSSFLSSEGMGAVIYLGVFSTCLCYFLQTTAQQHVHSAKAAIILSTESLFGTIFSVLLGYDPLSPQMVVGGIIILISITMTEIKLPFGKKEKPILVEKRED